MYEFTSQMQVTLTRVMGTDLDVARAAWVSTRGERAEDEKDSERVAGLINMLMRDRHGSPFEQCSLQFLTSAPIFVWREHYRHRIASYNEQSGRYSVLQPKFYLPSAERNLVQQGKPGAYTFVAGSPAQFAEVCRNLSETSVTAYVRYIEMLDHGIAKEVARMVLPLTIYSTAYVQMNLRALMNFLSLRTKNPGAAVPSFPQREIEMVAEKYEALFRSQFPLTYQAFQTNGRVAP